MSDTNPIKSIGVDALRNFEYVTFIVFYDFDNSGTGSTYTFDEIQLID